ncbi:MAG: hypothetical protein ACNI3H_12625 [Halarcobacter ebronensis]
MNIFADEISSVTGLKASVDTNGLVTINSLIPGKDYNSYRPAAINDGNAPS